MRGGDEAGSCLAVLGHGQVPKWVLVKVKQALEISLAELKTWEINYFN